MSSIGDLINQMNPKIDPEVFSPEERFKKPPKEEKIKSTIKETEFDYYKILGVESTATQLEIKRAYQSKIKKLHPDKISQTKENIAKYKLVCEAKEILGDPYERKAYDMQRKMDDTCKDFISQKESYKDFVKLQEQNLTEENKTIAKLNFEQKICEFDKKHGYDKSKALDKILEHEYDRMVDDYDLQRSQETDELDLCQDNLFDKIKYTPQTFNDFFEKKKKRDEKRKSKSGDITKYDPGIAAFNDFDGESGGVGIDQYENVYDNGKFNNFNNNYAGIGTGLIGNDNGQSDDDISLDSLDENEYDKHNKGVTKEDLDAAMKKIMEERSGQNDLFENMKPSDYGSALDDKFGISNQLGFMVGTDKFGHQKNIKKKDIKEETLKAYKQLTEK